MWKPVTKNKPIGIWLYGKPGVGKDTIIRDTFDEEDLYLKQPNRWWC